MRRYDDPEPNENFGITVTRSPHDWTGVVFCAKQKPLHPVPHLTPKQVAPQHTGLHPSSKHGTEHMDPDGTPTVVVGNLSDLSVAMFFVSPLSSARSLKSGRWTTAQPTDAFRHPTAGVKASVSRRMFGCPKTALNRVVAREPANKGDHGLDVAAFGLARSASHPASYRAIEWQILRRFLPPHLGPSEIDGAPADELNNTKECGAPDDTPNRPTTSNASKPWYSPCSDMRHILAAQGFQRSIWTKYRICEERSLTASQCFGEA
jgi:hypothetical protein